MDLGAFLADDSLGGGSWADEEVDMSSIGVQLNTGSAQPSRRPEQSFNRQSSFGDDDPRRERKEFPIPDEPPYRARVGNLPWEVEEEALKRFFEDRMQVLDVVTDIKLPIDPATNRLKGFGFVTFESREALEEALNLSLSDFFGRKLFVNVAAPQRQDVFEMDWRAARSGPMSGGPPRRERERREEPDLDWGTVRSTSGGLPPRERRDRGEGGERVERRPRREEPDLDWGSVRSTSNALPPREKSNRMERERRPKKDEPELDWGSARSATVSLPAKERRERSERRPKKDDPSLDWSSVRGSAVGTRQGSERRPRRQDSSEWKKGQAPEQRNKAKVSNKKEEETEQRPQKSLYDVLAVEGESDEEVTNQSQQKVPDADQDIETLQSKTSELTVDSKNSEDWEVVGK
ncbi:uncharacterized protein PRCAT00002813001 [Priceomyces carsonii]|uniref:uncharacterized protein n=1 Tax=Priceomyces carsonii TaxID=28549 RepID=UPI002EDA82D2|nr:unnamed protein product [Priceomyces carsonii]